MTIKVSIDGTIRSEHQARISVFDRGFLYGDSVYEVIRTYGGQPFALTEHIERLRKSGELLHIPLPVAADELRDEVRQVVLAAGNPESYIRLMITRGSGPILLDPAAATQPRRVIIVSPLRVPEATAYEQGVGIALIPAGRSAGGVAPLGAKSGNYLVNLMALGRAREQGAHEAVLLDAEGRIAEGASSNIFALSQDGGLRTPPVSMGILQGITRQKVIEIAQGQGIAVEEQMLVPDDLLCAKEVMLTSTLREILPVTEVDGTAIGTGHPGPVAQQLLAEYRRTATQTELGCGNSR